MRSCVFTGEGIGELQEMEPSDYADEQYGYFQEVAESPRRFNT